MPTTTMTTTESLAWATLPPDSQHRPVWGKQHLSDDGELTLCGKTLPRDAFHICRRADGSCDECQVCQRVLDCRRKKGGNFLTLVHP